MKRFLQLLVVALMPLLMVGCYEDMGPDEPVVGNLSLSTEWMQVSANGGEYEVNVYTEYEYQMNANVSWVEILGTSSNAEYSTLYFKVLPNDTTSPREGAITVFCDDYNLSATLIVVQEAGEGVNTDLEEWSYLGVGKFRGAGVLDCVFNIDSAVEIEVDVYEHKDNRGVYMVLNPWLATIAYGFGYSTIEEALNDGITTTNANFIINASNPDAVIFDLQSLGVDLGYGDMAICSGYPNYFEDPAQGAGTLVDGHITFGPKTMLFYSPGINAALGHSEDAILYTNADGTFRLSLPGAVPLCSVELITAKFSDAFPEYASQYTDENAFAYGIWGKEIANAAILVAESSAVVAELNQGATLEQIVAMNGVVASADVLSAINSEYGYVQGVVGLTPGTEYIVAIYAENVYGKTTVAAAEYMTAGTRPSDPNHPCEITVDLNKMSVYMPEYAASYPDTHNVSFIVVGKDIVEAKSFMASTSAIEGVLAQGATLEEIVEGNADPFTAEVIAEINGAGFINGYINLKPGTSYTLVVWAKNIYGETIIVTDSHTTDAEPQVDYTGELVIGDYYMSCTMYAGTDSETTFENLFTVSPDGESVTDFIVTNIGANVSGINPQWMAKYDSAAGTLTLDGVEKGYEEYGNSFGAPYAYVDSARTQALAFLSFATADSTTGADPLVLKVDPWTKEIVGMQNAEFIAAIVELASGQILGYWGYFAGPSTTIVPYSSIAPSSVEKASAKVPFSSVNINKHVVTKQLRGLKMVKPATSATRSAKPAMKQSYQTLSGGKLSRKAFVGSKELKSNVTAFSSVKIAK